eukprot:361100-Chlamydomonas_euryale.AAC.27
MQPPCHASERVTLCSVTIRTLAGEVWHLWHDVRLHICALVNVGLAVEPQQHRFCHARRGVCHGQRGRALACLGLDNNRASILDLLSEHLLLGLRERHSRGGLPRWTRQRGYNQKECMSGGMRKTQSMGQEVSWG